MMWYTIHSWAKVVEIRVNGGGGGVAIDVTSKNPHKMAVKQKEIKLNCYAFFVSVMKINKVLFPVYTWASQKTNRMCVGPKFMLMVFLMWAWVENLVQSLLELKRHLQPMIFLGQKTMSCHEQN